jgi:hypothetical protein
VAAQFEKKQTSGAEAPITVSGVCGTAEAVPFQDGAKPSHYPKNLLGGLCI